MSVNESTIRDKLCNSLELLERGLTLLEIEKYLPNPQGTRGFVDILARDERGRYVLIELKRSDAASRQAIHEVLKYVEGSKVNLAVRDDELRIFIVSTEWDELLIPFSSFVERTSLSTSGFRLYTTAEGEPVSAERVQPLPLDEGRLFIAQHDISLYVSDTSLTEGISSYEAACKYKGINDYVLISLTAHPGFREKELASIKAAMDSMGLPRESDADLEMKITQHTHMLYFAPLRMESQACLEFIEKELAAVNPEELDEFLSYLDDTESGRSAEIHDKLFELDPQPHRDYIEMSYPAKFIKILDEEQWEIQEIRRYGAISNNVLLEDSAIIREIRGEQGVTKQKYRREFHGNDPKELSAFAAEVAECLSDNPIWRNHLLTCIPELKELGKHAKSMISVFNPSNTIFSIFNYIARPDGILYNPSYRIISQDNDRTQMIFGDLEATGKRPSMTEIVAEYFNGDPSELLTSLSWGGYEKRDARITRDIGLTYTTYKLVQENGKNKFWKLTELGWEKLQSMTHNQGLNEFIKNNEDFIKDIYDFFSSHWNGFLVTYHRDENIEFRT